MEIIKSSENTVSAAREQTVQSHNQHSRPPFFTELQHQGYIANTLPLQTRGKKEMGCFK